MIDPDGIHAVEQYVLAKYYLTTNVYRHKVRLITDQMIVRAIILGIEEDENRELRRLYSFEQSDAFISNYADWDDARFMGKFAEADSSRCGELLTRLKARRLLKRIFADKVLNFAGDAREVLMSLTSKENHVLRKKIEKGVGKVVEGQTGQAVPPDFVIAHSFDVKSVREVSRNDEAGILVETSPEPRPFTDESTLFASINEGYVDRYVEVYAPVEWDSPAHKKKIKRACHEEIRGLIEDHCRRAAKGNGR